jgi:hypothetical protein
MLCSKTRAFSIGYNESSNSIVIGTYTELLNVLQDYDSLIFSFKYINTSSVFQGTSTTVQSDIIHAVSKVVKDHIKREINSATFVAIVLD